MPALVHDAAGKEIGDGVDHLTEPRDREGLGIEFQKHSNLINDTGWMASARPLAAVMTLEPTIEANAGHDDSMDPNCRDVGGHPVHHGLWLSGRESQEEATEQLSVHVLSDLGLAAGFRLAVIGCGYGGTARLAAQRYGVDVVGLTLSRAQKGFGGTLAVGRGSVELRVQDWKDARFPKGSFDALISLESLEPIADKRGLPAWRASESGRVDGGPWKHGSRENLFRQGSRGTCWTGSAAKPCRPRSRPRRRCARGSDQRGVRTREFAGPQPPSEPDVEPHPSQAGPEAADPAGRLAACRQEEARGPAVCAGGGADLAEVPHRLHPAGILCLAVGPCRKAAASRRLRARPCAAKLPVANHDGTQEKDTGRPDCPGRQAVQETAHLG